VNNTGDIIDVEILADGTIKIKTDTISPANHLNADKLLDFISKMSGSEAIKTRKDKAHAHEHKHIHAHRHN
jgi:hypothetical protein